MRAEVQHGYGGLEVVEPADLPAPDPGPGEVVVGVRAAALNRLDVMQRRGPPLIPGFSLPHIGGMDVAGDVVALGPGVAPTLLGRRVVVNPSLECGRCRWCLRGDDGLCTHLRVVGGNVPGGFAERCAVPATHVYPIPEGVGYAEAAAVPTAWSAAWKALVIAGRIRMGETVVIHAAGSGVSVAAIQIAKRAGATVIATAGSGAKLERARALGADVVVNNRTDDVVGVVRAATSGIGADLVLDHVGPALWDTSVLALRPRGRLVFCGATTGAAATLDLPYAFHFGLSFHGVEGYSHREFDQMLEFYWRGGFDPVVDAELPLDQVREAQRRMEQGELFGKIVLRP